MSWANIHGHDSVRRAFERAYRRGRLAHAYLFVGPKGVGKKLVAVELAKTLLCEDPGALEKFQACDRCHGCVQIAAGTHPDFQQASLPEDRLEFPISVMQEVIRNLSMKPARGRHRAAIIDDADSLNDESANCFLKTLEEPPPASLLILIGTSPDRQLQTIVSRCQVMRFSPLPADVLAERLLKEGLVEKRADAEQLARLSGGSFAAAAALADPNMAQFRRELFQNLSSLKFDSVALAKRVVEFVDEAGKESAPKRQRASLIIKFIVEFLESALQVQQGIAATLSDAQVATRLAESFDADELLQLLDRCLEADYQVDRRLQLVLVVEALIDRLGSRLAAHTA